MVDAEISVDHVIEIAVDDEEIVGRLSGRRVHPASGRVYHIVHNPPVADGRDDITSEPLIQREDDEEETVRKRLDVYQQQQMIAILWTLNSEKDAKISELTDIVNASLNFNQSPEDDSSGNQDDAPPDDAPEPNATPTMDDVMSADKAWKKKGAKDVVHEFQECRYKCGFTLANKPRKKMYLHHTKCPLKKNKNTPAEE